MYIRVASLVAVVMGAVACSAVPANGGHYQTYVASLCAFEQDLWTAASEAYNIEFNYDVKIKDTAIPLPGWTFKTKAVVTGEPPPGGSAIRVSDKPDLINLALLSNGIKPLVASGAPQAVNTVPTCDGNVCNTGPCVTVTSNNPAQVEWVNLEPTDGVYTTVYNVAYDFTPYVMGWSGGGGYDRCPDADYSAIHTLIEPTLKLGKTLEDSAFVVELEARLPLQKAGESTCEDTLVTFTYQSGGLANTKFLNLVLAKREETRLANEVRLAEGVQASLQQVQVQISGISTSNPESYRIRNRPSDETLSGNALSTAAGALEAVAPLAEQFGIDLDPDTVNTLLDKLHLTNIAPGQELEGLAQGVLLGNANLDELATNLNSGDLQDLGSALENAYQQLLSSGLLSGEQLAGVRGRIESLREELNIGGSGEQPEEVSTFDPQADNPHNLPVSHDGDSKDCAIKCQVDPSTMAPYSDCGSYYKHRFVPGAGEGMPAGTHYRAAWYPGIGTVAQVCTGITIARANSEPLTTWQWQTYKVIQSNPNGYQCGDWAPSLGDISKCPYSEANGLTCGVYSKEYCEPTQ